MQPQEQQTARSIVISLLSHCHDLLGSQAQTSSRSQALFEAIRQYIEVHYPEPLSRESVAQAFYLSLTIFLICSRNVGQWASMNI